MKKNIFIWVPTIVAMAVLSLQVFAIAQNAAIEKPSLDKSTIRSEGNVMKINLRELAITISSKANAPLIIYIEPGMTKITKGSKNTSIADIKKGDFISAEYNRKWSKNIAKTIDVMDKPASPQLKEKTIEESQVKKDLSLAKPVPKTASISGKVAGLNVQSSTSTVAITTNKGESLLVIIDKDTKFTKTVNSGLTDIEEGDTIAATYETESGANIAKLINIKKITSIPAKKKSK